jgi:hypothetical protein
MSRAWSAKTIGQYHQTCWTAHLRSPVCAANQKGISAIEGRVQLMHALSRNFNNTENSFMGLHFVLPTRFFGFN